MIGMVQDNVIVMILGNKEPTTEIEKTNWPFKQKIIILIQILTH